MKEVRAHTNRAVLEFVAAALRSQRITALFYNTKLPPGPLRILSEKRRRQLKLNSSLFI